MMIPGKKLIGRSLADVLNGLLDLLYPPRCHICGQSLLAESNKFVCNDCMEEVVFVKSPLCIKCGKQLNSSTGSQDHYCGDCLKDQPPFDSVRSVVVYAQPVVGLLHRLKYRGDTSVTGAIKEILAHSDDGWVYPDCDIIVPVPLHRDRLRKRGMNQSLVLAGLAFPDYKTKINSDLLVRVKNTSPQTGLGGIERRENLKGAFEVNNMKTVQEKNIWLIDDVFTTGTTVDECAKTLKKAGASVVHVWTFSRV